MPAPEPGQRWGILGGTFDPVHLGHLGLATDVSEARQLDGVLLVPTFDPPHRLYQPRASFDDRVAMLDLACTDRAVFEVSCIEKELDRPSYTLQTVRALRKRYEAVDFFFIMGADNLNQLQSWHRWQMLLQEIKLMVGCRPGADLRPIAGFPRVRIDMVETSLCDLSSTEIRRAAQQGLDEKKLSRMVPSPVAAYIVEKGLYR